MENREELYCDECGEPIKDEVYFIGDNGTALNTDNNTFCSEECILKYIMADSMPVEDWIG